MKNPCHHCTKRWVRGNTSCHGHCKEEAEFKASVRPAKEAQRKSRMIENSIIGYEIAQYHKNRKGR